MWGWSQAFDQGQGFVSVVVIVVIGFILNDHGCWWEGRCGNRNGLRVDESRTQGCNMGFRCDGHYDMNGFGLGWRLNI